METSRKVMRADLLAKGVPPSLTDAVVQKVADHHSSRYRYLEMREHLRKREYCVKGAAAAAGIQLPHPPAIRQFDQYVPEKCFYSFVLVFMRHITLGTNKAGRRPCLWQGTNRSTYCYVHYEFKMNPLPL